MGWSGDGDTTWSGDQWWIEGGPVLSADKTDGNNVVLEWDKDLTRTAIVNMMIEDV